jgi:hypothetical protein
MSRPASFDTIVTVGVMLVDGIMPGLIQPHSRLPSNK